jgi:SAM-dependent methyltransferase
MDIFFEIHKDLPREGPGDRASTERAYRTMERFPENARLLDVGCGPGQQTLDLAALSTGQIDAVDTHQPFLDELGHRASAAGLRERIHPHNMSMDALNFPPASFDLIWSEGAIYIMGFENGLRNWKKLLKPGGYVAVTEATWLEDNPPQEVRDFWDECYPAMLSIEGNLKIIKRLGYRLLDYFVLPDLCWRENYYQPLEKRIATLREKHQNDPEWVAQLDTNSYEIEIFEKYSAWYGYVFYVMQIK